ncbi:MAG: hypothetical protein ABJB40_01620 [Acidobacteriota bacterium]
MRQATRSRSHCGERAAAADAASNVCPDLGSGFGFRTGYRGERERFGWGTPATGRVIELLLQRGTIPADKDSKGNKLELWEPRIMVEKN